MSLLLPERVANLIGKSFEHKVNCFCISEFFYRQTNLRQATADEMLNFVSQNFRQVGGDGNHVLTLVWSRSSFQIPVGQIKIHELAKRRPGFPFGLVLEHSFVQIEDGLAFQKADPTLTSKIELTPVSKALSPYLHVNGFELTHHIPLNQL